MVVGGCLPAKVIVELSALLWFTCDRTPKHILCIVRQKHGRILLISGGTIGNEGRVAFRGAIELCVVVFVLFSSAKQQAAVVARALEVLTGFRIELCKPRVNFYLFEHQSFARVCA